MKFFLFFTTLLFGFNTYGQQVYQTQKKPIESRFQVAKRVIENSFLNVPRDFTEMGKIVSNDWKKTATWAGSILGLVVVDKYTTGFLHDHIEPAIEDYRLPDISLNDNLPSWLKHEDAYITYSLAGLYAGSLLFNKERGQIAAANGIKSLAYSYLISHIVFKALFARNRPHRNINDNLPFNKDYHTRNNWEFGQWHPIELDVQKPTGSKGTAFPSFHATAFFAVAKVMQMEYDNYWIPYGVMSAVFLSNMKGHDHWVSDLVFGGLVGTVIGKAIVKNSRKQRAKRENSVTKASKKIKFEKKIFPTFSNNTASLYLVATF
jgi:membrane-associated phospholipid phosphatase